MADNDNMVKLTIDGQEVSVPKGTTVLEAARMMDIEIPYFCWHPKLKPVGACRMCYVEVENRPKLEVSCATECMPDMIVHTQSPKVLQGRRAVLEFTLANHPLDCPTCDKGGECDLQDLTFTHGIDESRFDFAKYRHIRDKNSTFDDLRIGPEIIRNQNRCILCYRCVRSNKEIFGQYDLGAFQRGNITEINAAPGRKVESIYSGNLVEICPVGALTNTDWRYKIRVWKAQNSDSVCQFCADGCNIKLWTGRGNILRVTSRRNDDIDEGWICNVGRYGYQIVHPDNRLRTPLIKKGDSQVAATWEEALGLIASKFKEIKDKKGGVCIGGLISPNQDSASLYTFSKFFRTVLGSNNVDYRLDYKMLPEKSDNPYTRLAQLPFSITDIEKSDLIIVLGSNLIKDHPIVNLRVRKTVKTSNAKLYTLNPYATQSADISIDEMIHKPGTLDALINGICVALCENNQKLDESVFGKMSAPGTVEDAGAICGIAAERIRELSKALIEANNVTIIAGEIFNSSIAREQLATALSNLISLGGLEDRGQVGILPKCSNSKGAENLGVVPFISNEMLERLKSIWGDYPECDGLAADRMILAATKEDIDSLFIVGSNPVVTYPDGQFMAEGLEKLDFLVAADLCETETTALADVVLPLSGWSEYNGTFVNLEGRVQSFRKALKRFGHSLPVYEIMIKLAGQMKAKLFKSDEELESEYKSILEKNIPASFQWDVTEVKHSVNGKNEEYPIPLYVVDQMHHFNHLTEKSKSLSAFCGESYLEISPTLAEKYHAEDNTLMRIESEIGKVVLPVKISEILDGDVVLVTRNFSATPVNIFQMRKQRVDYVKLTRLEEK
jgi:NADH-quinone oxidoreductase chain G